MKEKNNLETTNQSILYYKLMNFTQNQPVQPPQVVNQEVKLVDIPIVDENTALNVMVSFLHHAQRRGVFSIDESAKIYECIKVFQPKSL